jgi:predicted RNase H-like HicB family nuclease
MLETNILSPYPVATMTYAILLEPIEDQSFPPGYYYAHIPSFGLTAHGLGVDGAREMARDLLNLWIAEKKSNGEVLPAPGNL